MGLAISPVVTLATNLVVGSAPPERAGAASAISETSAEFGGALSIAILGSIGAKLLAAAREAFTHALGFTATVSAVLALATAAIAAIALRGVAARGQSESVAAT